MTNKDIKLFFHGASVTQQDGDQSYLHHFKVLADDIYTVDKVGYGGTHFNEGSISLERDILNSRGLIKICFLEWQTAQTDSFSEYKLRHIIGILLRQKIVPVFLILARKDCLHFNRDSDESVFKISEEIGIPVLDYRGIINHEEDLRDVCHTNANGAKKYAIKLFEDIPNILKRSESILNIDHSFYKLSIDYHKLNLNLTETSSIKIFLKNLKTYPEIILDHYIGPYSPYVSINNIEVLFWDKWCHYERHDFKSAEVINNSTVISVLKKEIDYSSCLREFPVDRPPKKIALKGFFTVDCEVESIEI